MNKLSYKQVGFGSLEAFNVVVEIEQGSNLKYEYDEASDEMKLNFTFSAKGGSLSTAQAGASGGELLVFPFSYGFIPQTLGGDGDTLDAIVLSSHPIKSGSVVVCKAVGIMQTLDRGDVDDKIIAVPLNDQLAEKYQDVADLPPDSLQKWTEFYLEVARQKKKVIKIIGLQNKQVALEEIKKSFK